MINNQAEERGCHQIGALTAKIVSSLETSSLIQTTSPPGSSIIGSPSQGGAALNEIGTPLGETGAARPPTTEEMAGMSQVALDQMAMASVPRRLGSRLEWRHNGSGESELRLIGSEPVDRQDVETALTNLGPLMAPASETSLATELSRVRALTARQAGVENEMAVAAWLDSLKSWPADVAMWALREWPSRSKWWPTWYEIKALMSERAHRRKTLVERLKARVERVALHRDSP